MPDQNEILKSLLGNSPWAAIAYLLGRQLIKAWDEDRKQLRDLQPQIIALLAKAEVAIAGMVASNEGIQRRQESNMAEFRDKSCDICRMPKA